MNTKRLYWRTTAGEGGKYHCFERTKGSNFKAICGEWAQWMVRGNQTRRPMLWKRCPECNALEMKYRGWDEPAPASPKGATW